VRRVAILLGVVLVAGSVVLLERATSRAPRVREAVTVLEEQAVEVPHQFTGDHAPFISVARYGRFHRRRDPRFVLVDVRDRVSRTTVRIRGDVWVPLSDMETTGWQALQKYRDRILVLYCACPWAEAAEASVILEGKGYVRERLRVLREGVPGWQRAGYPTSSGGDPCRQDQHWPEACSA
jgi:rhodanese-related sulfurtransferase